MKRSLRWLAVSSLSIFSITFYVTRPATAASGDAQVATADDLESQAIDAIHQGHFDQCSQLFSQAATANPVFANVAHWAADFDTEEHSFAAERQTQFEKNVK